jgi:hypothetical protein
MAHFAEIDENNIVQQVIVVNNEDCLDSEGNESEAVGISFCQSLFGVETNWVQTSFNSNIRFRYAGIGMKYDSTNDVFYPQSPYPSWRLDTFTWIWNPPVSLPHDEGSDSKHTSTGNYPPTEYVSYDWDEDSKSWTNRTVRSVLHLYPSSWYD